MKRYAVYNREGNRMYQFPTYGDLMTACHALKRLQETYPDAGLYLKETEA